METVLGILLGRSPGIESARDRPVGTVDPITGESGERNVEEGLVGIGDNCPCPLLRGDLLLWLLFILPS